MRSRPAHDPSGRREDRRWRGRFGTAAPAGSTTSGSRATTPTAAWTRPRSAGAPAWSSPRSGPAATTPTRSGESGQLHPRGRRGRERDLGLRVGALRHERYAGRVLRGRHRHDRSPGLRGLGRGGRAPAGREDRHGGAQRQRCGHGFRGRALQRRRHPRHVLRIRGDGLHPHRLRGRRRRWGGPPARRQDRGRRLCAQRQRFRFRGGTLQHGRQPGHLLRLRGQGHHPDRGRRRQGARRGAAARRADRRGRRELQHPHPGPRLRDGALQLRTAAWTTPAGRSSTPSGRTPGTWPRDRPPSQSPAGLRPSPPPRRTTSGSAT